MCRTIFIALVLAALSVTSANAAPVPPAKPHKITPCTAPARAAHRRTPHKPALQTTTHRQTPQTATHRQSAQDVGRAAGLKIRQQLAQRQALAQRRHPVERQPLAQRRTEENRPYAPETARRLPAPPFRPQAFSADPASEQQAYLQPPPVEASDHAPITPRPTLRRSRLVMPPPLRGSFLSLERQNDKLAAEGLERIEDEEDLSGRIAHKLLVPVPLSDGLSVNENLPEHHRYCRPWTARFLVNLARVHDAQFHKPLEVSSAVRTVAYQKRLIEVNSNAAPAEGDIVSPHLTGATVDIAKEGLSLRELAWMRSWLLPLEQAEKIDVEEEFQQACFHITVYKSYVPPRRTTKPNTALAASAAQKPTLRASGQRKSRSRPAQPPTPAASPGTTAQGD